MQAEPIEQANHMRRKSDAHGHVTDRVFEDQIPTDDQAISSPMVAYV